jgi:hypothetical protein
LIIVRVMLLVAAMVGSAVAIVLAVSAFLAVGWTAVAVIVLSIAALLRVSGRIARLAMERLKLRSER